MRGQIDGCIRARVHELVLGAIRHVQRRARLPVVSRAIDDREPRAGEDVDRFLAVGMTAGAPPDWDFGFRERRAGGLEAHGLADEHGAARVLFRLDPRELTCARDDPRALHPIVERRAAREPVLIEVAHAPRITLAPRAVTLPPVAEEGPPPLGPPPPPAASRAGASRRMAGPLVGAPFVGAMGVVASAAVFAGAVDCSGFGFCSGFSTRCVAPWGCCARSR